MGQEYETPTTNTLLDDLAHDLAATFPQVVMAYQRRLFAFALRLTGSRQDAEDITQEAFVAAYVTLENYPAERIRTLKLQGWLYSVTLNVWRHAVRGQRLLLAPLDDATAAGIEDAPAERPDALFEDRERRAELDTLVSQLPDRYRVAVICYYFEDLSYQEIADLLDQPLGTVKSVIFRGVRLLRHLAHEQDQRIEHRNGKEGQPWTTSMRAMDTLTSIREA